MTVQFAGVTQDNAEVADEVLAHWREMLVDAQFVGGPHVAGFEDEFAAYCRAEHAVGVANGTDAIELILRALDLPPGGEVILPANTFIATAEAVVAAGLVPHFVDVLPDTLLIDPAAVSASIGPRTAAVVAVHLYGQVARMEDLLDVAGELPVIEDAAQAQGASRHGRRAGAMARAAAFSFYPGKNLGACGDAGAVTTDDPRLAATVRQLADHGRGPQRWSHVVVGRNSRLDALQAVALRAKLRRLDGWNAHRRQVHQWYRENLADDRVRAVEIDPHGVSAHHLEVVLVPRRADCLRALSHHGIQASAHYGIPCHRQRPYERFPRGPLPVVESTSPQVISLPIHAHLSRDEVDTVCSALRAVLGEQQPVGVQA